MLAQSNFLIDLDENMTVTDRAGYCSVLLLRGMRLTVGVAGTGLVRDIVAPTDPTIDEFNLFDPSVGSDDAFVVRVPTINIAERQPVG